MTLELCVRRGRRPATTTAPSAYEDEVLAWCPAHGGRVVSRVRRDGGDRTPRLQVIHLPGEQAMQDYLVDPAPAWRSPTCIDG